MEEFKCFRIPFSTASAAFVMFLILQGTASFAGWIITDLPPTFDPIAITNAGQVLGFVLVDGDTRHVFRWENGIMRDLGTLGGADISPRAINNAGQVVGDIAIEGGTTRHAFLWENGIMHDLGTLGGGNSNATAINNAGQVVGASTTIEGHTHAFLWENGIMHDLGTLGDQTAWLLPSTTPVKW
jgi:probable HAF family extracellular repeat protein